ncbi:CYSTEINE-RICH RECEPTOR-LIKE PROTEIN KINASE 10 ISOFORM X1 [Salix viminalis]|uniref:CYSTEINE-RICH RECEPTOR-LIKE PROTEIN KINASE 10 ISOFORM X1 n=1 Tax=Salix viminalis TaxID=40686 RepID=A0A9Q0QHS8_SALVM|nr:CYSTEINE-RICH RECEPTOR-LIKE PROTEIN KINASE 10 ISOFORM X1 [Salix viminalis]
MNSLKFYCILLSLLNIAIIILAQDDATNVVYHNCENATTSTMNSTYRVNLNLVLSSLASNATRNNINGFYNTSFGQNPDQVYGLFICRGDVSNTACQNCVTFATKDVVQRCPIGIASIILYDECHLRYSNSNFFSKVDQNPFWYMWNAQNTTYEPQRFNNLVATSVNDCATQAASAPPGAKKFAVNQTYIDGFQNIYSLAQCTPDLSSSDCKKCLSTVISRLPICCSSKIGARVYAPSCYIRYEIDEFYDATAVAAESVPPPPPLPPVTLPVPEGKYNTVIIIIILSAVISVIAILIISFYTISRKRKSREEVKSGSVDDAITRTESLQYNLEIIHLATDNFSEVNKLGQGGFGSVYKVQSIKIFVNEEEEEDLLTYTWENWNSGPNLHKLIDPTLRAGSRNEMLRCIHVGLLCVQENALDRPNMASVAVMLSTYSITLPVPQKPPFFGHSSLTETTSSLTESDQSRSASVPFSHNEASISELRPR